MDQQTTAELDVMRCRAMRGIWYAASVFGTMRILGQQLRLLTGFQRTHEGFDYSTEFKPEVVNPRSLDIWYMVTSLIFQLLLILVNAETDFRDLLLVYLSIGPLFAILTRRIWCFLLSMAAGYTQILWVASSQGTWFLAKFHIASILVVVVLPLLGIFITRWLLHHFIVLKMELHKRMGVELGATALLLQASFDAVVHVDETLKFTENSQHLGALLRQSALAGKSMLEFFSQPDQDRICKQVVSSILNDALVMALNAEMLDVDQNPLPVEMVFAQFRNLSYGSRFLVGVRELTDEEMAPQQPQHESPAESISMTEHGEDFVVVIEVPSMDILAMSAEMEILCEKMHSKPESILDLCSSQSRESFEGQLKCTIGRYRKGQKGDTVSFNLMGLGEVTSSVVVEHDDFLQCLVASVHMQSAALPHLSGGERLTEANIQRLQHQELTDIYACSADISPPGATCTSSRTVASLKTPSQSPEHVLRHARPMIRL
eukprot:Skav230648  [mRNA]  locus=scaffold2103:100609:102072:- [translate_table: standard]